jgi:alpha,alpha-trehalase
VELTHQSSQNPQELYRNLRAAAESGWDFSNRWFRDGKSFGSIHTTEIIPVDLNCLLYHLEQVLAEGHQQTGDSSRAK